MTRTTTPNFKLYSKLKFLKRVLFILKPLTVFKKRSCFPFSRQTPLSRFWVKFSIQKKTKPHNFQTKSMKTKFILYRLAQLANMKWELLSQRVTGTVINTSVAFSDVSVYFQGRSILGRVSNLDNNKGKMSWGVCIV